MGNYVNPSEILTWPSGTSDAEKIAAIDNAEQLIEKIIGTHFYSKTFDIQINGNGKNRIFLPLHGNILTVREVYVHGTLLTPTWYKWDESSVMLDTDAAMNEVADGDFEDWADATALTYWTKFEAGGSTVNRDLTDVQSGTYSLRMDVDALNSDVYVYQDIDLQPNRGYTLTIYRMMSIAARTARFMLRDSGSNVWLQSDGTWGAVATWITLANALTMTAYTLDFTAHSRYRDYRIYLDRFAGTSASLYFDDVSIETAEGGGIDDPELLYRLGEAEERGIFPRGYNNIRLVGTFGYGAVPQPIIELAKIMVNYDNDPSLYTSTLYGAEKIGDYSYKIGAGVYSKIKVYTGIFEADKIIAIYIRQKKPILQAP